MVIIVLFWVGIHLIVKGGEKPGEMEASRFRGFFVCPALQIDGSG